jgi:hypothetical protein
MFRLCGAKEEEEEEEKEEEEKEEEKEDCCSRVSKQRPTFVKNATCWGYCCPVDLNMAPHINMDEEEKLLTLALCKPNIRKGAKIGDWVVAKQSKSIHGVSNYIRYVWRVTDIQDIQTYYTSEGKRKDKIYGMVDGVLQHKNETKFHNGPKRADQQRKDLKEDCKVLLSTEFCSIDPTNPVFFELSSRSESIFKVGIQMGENCTYNLTMEEQEELYQFVKLNSIKK